jgi:hypothetical protein
MTQARIDNLTDEQVSGSPDLKIAKASVFPNQYGFKPM